MVLFRSRMPPLKQKIGTRGQARSGASVYDSFELRNRTYEQSGWSGRGRPPLCNRGELPGHPGENAGSGAPGISKPDAIPQVVPNRGRRNSGSDATTAIVGTSSIPTGAY